MATLLPPTPTPEEEETRFGNVDRIMQVFRIARIMRIFKLARRSSGLQSIAHTVKTSWKDGEEGTGFISIPQGMWWAVQTLTSLGYGDIAPETFLGKVVGSCCAVCGVLIMALPIHIVVDNFADYYSEQKKLEAKEMKKEAQQKQAELEMAAAQVNFIFTI